MSNKKGKIEITELFMATKGGDFNHCFHGTIRRETDASGCPVVYGKVKVLNGFICAMASDQWTLGERLDEMVLIVLEMGLHSDNGDTSQNGNISLN